MFKNKLKDLVKSKNELSQVEFEVLDDRSVFGQTGEF